MKIRLIEEHELNKVKNIYDNVVKEMNLRGLYNWNESYPNTEIIFKDISNKHLYGIETSGEIVAVPLLMIMLMMFITILHGKLMDHFCHFTE